MVLQQGVLARLHDPREVDAGPGAPERARHRDRVDDVAEGGELHDGDFRGLAHRALWPKRVRMVEIRSLVECVLGSPAMATFAPTASTVPRSGTLCAV